MSRKVLIVTGDGGDSYEALYAIHRFLEAMWRAGRGGAIAPQLHMVYHDLEPGWDTYVERLGHSIDADVAITAVATREFAAVVILGGRAPRVPAQRRQRALAGARIRRTGKCICRHRPRNAGADGGGNDQGTTVACHPHVRIEVEQDRGDLQSETGRPGRQAGDGPGLEERTRNFTGKSLPAWAATAQR